jgi:hypothetical protein
MLIFQFLEVPWWKLKIQYQAQMNDETMDMQHGSTNKWEMNVEMNENKLEKELL